MRNRPASFLRAFYAIAQANGECSAESLMLEVHADPQPVKYQRHFTKLGGNAKTHFMTGRGLLIGGKA